METISDLEKYKRKVESLPRFDPSLRQDYLHIDGFFNPTVRYTTGKTPQQIPAEFHKTASEIEIMIEQAFNLEAIGIECPVVIHPSSSPNILIYQGLIKAVKRDAAKAAILLRAFHYSYDPKDKIRYSDANLSFLGNFPINDDYSESTKSLLRGLWPLVKCVKYAEPTYPEDTQQKFFEAGSIFLIKNSRCIGTGQICLRKLGLNLEEKIISLPGEIDD